MTTKTSEEKTRTPARVILAIDRLGWAFHAISTQLQKYLGKKYNFIVMPYSEIQGQWADVVVCFWWRSLEKLFHDNLFKRSVLCVYDHFTWSSSLFDDFGFECALEKATTVGVANQKIGEMLNVRGHNKKPIILIEDGVDINLFKPYGDMPACLTFGWCGNSNAGNGMIKGLEMIREVCEKEDIELRVLDSAEGKTKPHHLMPQWHSANSAYVCMSLGEGTPNPPLEAMACGRPVITTDVGLMSRLIIDGMNGIFCERSTSGLTAAVKRFKKMDINQASNLARLSAETYSWKDKIKSWDLLLETTLSR